MEPEIRRLEQKRQHAIYGCFYLNDEVLFSPSDEQFIDAVKEEAEALVKGLIDEAVQLRVRLRAERGGDRS